MDLDDLTSKDLARIQYLIDLGLKKEESKKVDYKKLLIMLRDDIQKVLTNFDFGPNEEPQYAKKLAQEDEELIWKIRLLHKQRHREELEEKEDQEDWDEA